MTAKDLVYLTPSRKDTPALIAAKARMVDAILAQAAEVARCRALGVPCGVYSQVTL